MIFKNNAGKEMINMLRDYLYDTFGTNVPIFTSEIKYKNYSRSWIFAELKKLCSDKELIRYDRGVYYIPTDTIFGKSRISFDEVIEKKYISNGQEVFGFYGGVTLLNTVGLSTQIAVTPTIFTNAVTSQKRIITIGERKAILKKPRTMVNSSNVFALTFLEILSEIPEYYLDDKNKRNCIINFMKINAIRKDDISSLIVLYPKSTSKNYSKLIYDV